MSPIRVVVASQNPVKLRSVELGFARMFPAPRFTILPVSLQTGLPSQPMTDQETLAGAEVRARMAKQASPAADYWVGIEGGVEPFGKQLGSFAWVAILDTKGAGIARTGTFFLPDRVAELVRQGKELGEADDLVFGRTNSKQENGAVGILTGDVIDRTALYEQAVIMALIRFKNPELFAGQP